MPSSRSFLFLLLLVLIAGVPDLQAVEARAQAEIDYLLQFIEKSNCRFIRSGTEYSSKEAVDHLRSKLDKAGDKVKTTEDFISGIATQSYLTGKPYQVKLTDGSIQPTGPWLTKALAEHRKAGGSK